MPSYGEAWCLPAFDAMAMGNTPICTNTGGMADFLEDGGGILVDGTLEPAFGMTEGFEDLYTGREDCISINVRMLQKAMRKIYHLASNSDSEYLDLQKRGREIAEKYSYGNIGNKIKEALNVN
jgi:glycosyltransferase involved in cell wall biosynthesis